MNKATIISHNFCGTSLVVVYADDKGARHTKFVQTSHLNWPMVISLYKQGRYEEMIPLLDATSAITKHSGGVFTVVDGKVCYKGKVAESNYLFERIVFFMRELPLQYPRLLLFAENLYSNPDPTVIANLFKFLEHGGFTLTDDGCFLAYKGVNENFWSKTSGKIRVIKGNTKLDPTTSTHKAKDQKYFIFNGVGEVVKVDRADVCSDPSLGCEQGIHVGTFEYANNFKASGVIVICKVNPKNVCSVPSDETYKKVRACEYEVIAVEGRKLDEKRDSNYHKAAAVRYHNQRGPNGKFVSSTKPVTEDSVAGSVTVDSVVTGPKRDVSGRFCY